MSVHSDPSEMTTSARDSGRDAEDRISEELGSGLGSALIALAIAAHRHAMYPLDHPSLQDSLEVAVLELGRVLADRGSIAISVRDGRLSAVSALPEESHALLADLARRIDDHELGAIVFRRGVTIEEMQGVLDAISRDPHHPETRLGLLPVHERPGWEHVLLQPIGYEYLHPGERSSTRPGRSILEVWAEFKALSGAEPEGEGAEGVEDPVLFVATLTRVLDELGWDRGSGAEAVRDELEGWLERTPVDRVARWISRADQTPGEAGSDDAGGSPSGRLLVALSRSEVRLLVLDRLTRALSIASPTVVSSTLADSIARLEELAEAEASAAFEVEGLSAARAILDRAVIEGGSGRRGVAPGRWRSEAPSGPRGTDRDAGLSRDAAMRIVEMCLAVDRGGPALHRALRRLVRSADVKDVIALSEAAPPDSRAAREIEEFLVTPEQLRVLLSGDDVDDASLAAMVNRLGDHALDPLFDRLAGSESRTIRRKIFDCLTAMGERVSGTVMSYLEDPPWFVQRNMLALLQRMPALPHGFSPLQHLAHEDARVRREALPLALRVPGARDEALRLALDDPDERIVRMALLELQEDVPASVLPVLVEKGLREPRFPELGSLAARALGGSEGDAARDALVDRCREGRQLAPGDPTLLSALVALASGWGHDPAVQEVLDLAGRSTDPRIRAALARVRNTPGDGDE
ncbi:MAG: hypothetical protein EA351_06575 [Gemmatimonadales bacterium]|nr:MAG: hypothetical protein EA351_06575 [Gemmatimonadales bacterium]